VNEDARNAVVGAAAWASRALLAKAIAIAAVLALVGLMVVGTLSGSGGTQSAAALDPCVPADAPGVAAPPLPAGGTSAESLAIARQAAAVATSMHLPGRAVLIILMTGLQESGIRNLDHGDRDSLGWLQQRPSQGWGTAAQIRDPSYGAGKFFAALVAVPGWSTMALTDAAQAVQRSAYPDAYARHETNARTIAAEIGADVDQAGAASGGGTTQPAAGSASGGCDTSSVPPEGANPDGTWPAETATTCPDPTTGAGCITPRLLALVNAAKATGLNLPKISCWDAHAWNPTSDHPRGKACDLSYSHGFAAGAELAAGNAMSDWVLVNAKAYGVKYVIWQGKIWYARTGAWEPYTGAGIYDPNDASGGHWNHIHVSVF